MKNGFLKAAVAFLLAVVMSFSMFASQAWATGDFSKSCDGSAVYGSILLSNCRRINGSYNDTSIDLNKYISNVDGLLKWDPSGGFIYSCENICLSSSLKTRHTEMNADCEVGDYLVEDRIDLDEHIANIDGVLTYE